VISIKGHEVARFELPKDHDLAIANEPDLPKIEGIATTEPSFGMPAVWTPSVRSLQARNSGYSVVDPISVLSTHLMEVVRRHAHELFGLQEMRKLLDLVSVDQPKVVEEIVPKQLSLAVIHRVFQNLLRERISIRDAASIIEAAGEASFTTKNVVLITEYVRHALRRSIVEPYLDRDDALRAYTLDGALDQSICTSVQHGDISSQFAIAPNALRDLIQKIQSTVGTPSLPVAVLVSAGARHFLQQAAESVMKNVSFLSYNDVPPATRVINLGVIR
jgi:flagellar biosynthesis protein FlhA